MQTLIINLFLSYPEMLSNILNELGVATVR